MDKEQSRLFIAVALSIFVFVVWDLLFVDRKAVQQPEQTTETEQAVKEKPYVKDNEIQKAIKASSQKADASRPIQKARTITVNSPLYTVKISERGAVFKSFVLKDYKESIDADSPAFEMISPDNRNGTVRVNFTGSSFPELENAVFLSQRKSDSVDISAGPEEIVFSWISPRGIVVEKQFVFSPETYMIGFNVTVKNGSDLAIKDSLILSLAKLVPEKTARYGFEGPSALLNDELEQIKMKKIKDKSEYTGKLGWIAVQDRYFISSIIPKEPYEAGMGLSLTPDNILEGSYIQPVSVINPGNQHIFEYRLFFGPKSLKLLNTFDCDLVKAINFGFFDILAKPCVWIMNFLYDHFISNYGVAIIILTLFTKIILWPLGNKSYKSMNQMKKIQPLLKEIRTKYKDDKKKQNEEMMALYKTYKVNPMGGCLPMFVQIPVFFALYRMLYEAIELRHAPFFGWITDLSAPDRLFSFDFSIPFMQAPYGIPVLTIIMGATMFIQQSMSPPVGDDTQAKMMKLMPIAFTFIFINFSSGLVLYWLVNNVLSIAQQYYVLKKSD